MNSNTTIEGKKLLVLGAGPMWIDIVTNAHELGLHTTAVDWHVDKNKSPAKLVAKKSYDIDIFDTDSLLDIIKNDNIDGVLTGYTDIVLRPYVDLCQKTGFWCYGTPSQFLQLSNKISFKNLCRRFSVPVVDGIEISSKNLKNVNTLKTFPLVVKPADSCGARGISVAHTHEDLCKAIDYAGRYSKSKTYIIESFLDRKTEFMACYTIVNGKIALSALCDRFKTYDIAGFSAIPTCQYYPSVYIDRYLNDVDPSIRLLIKHINLKNCYLSIQGFVDSEHFWVNEAGFRLGGGQFYNFTEAINGTNTLKRLIRYSITGNMLSSEDSISLDNCMFDKICGTIFLNARPGIICAIEGLDTIQSDIPEVIHIMQQAQPGDKVESTGSLNHVVARIKILASDRITFAKVSKMVTSRCRVLDSKGVSMLLRPISFSADGCPLDG